MFCPRLIEAGTTLGILSSPAALEQVQLSTAVFVVGLGFAASGEAAFISAQVSNEVAFPIGDEVRDAFASLFVLLFSIKIWL